MTFDEALAALLALGWSAGFEERPGVGFPTVRKGWQEKALVFMMTALILAIVVVLVLAFTAQRLLNNA